MNSKSSKPPAVLVELPPLKVVMVMNVSSVGLSHKTHINTIKPINVYMYMYISIILSFKVEGSLLMQHLKVYYCLSRWYLFRILKTLEVGIDSDQ